MGSPDATWSTGARASISSGLNCDGMEGDGSMISDSIGPVFEFEGGFTPVQNELLRWANASRDMEAVLDYADGRTGAARFRVAQFEEG